MKKQTKIKKVKMKQDVTGKKELASLKFDWKIYQLNAASTKCCAGGTRDATRIPGKRGKNLKLIPLFIFRGRFSNPIIASLKRELKIICEVN